MTGITRRAVLASAGAVAVAGVPGAVLGEDAELVTLGRQWLATYGKWLRPTCGSKESGLLKKVCAIEDRMADIPARSHDGALVKLRVAAEHYRLMGDIDCDPYARLAYQAWQGLETEPVNFERLMGEVAS
ncbi:MAG: hypothetical protein O7D27_02645 [Alphaproteobacteria bacterium]|nr:hypothetical protein [Alphaproteobacteria bacterium]